MSAEVIFDQVCLECGEGQETLFPDTKIPPLDTEPCLCRVCAHSHAAEQIEEHEGEIAMLREFIGNL
jgi:hypothetical protein